MKQRIAQWVGNHLPRSVVYYATIRAWSYSTAGHPMFMKDNPVTLPVSDVVKRWGLTIPKDLR